MHCFIRIMYNVHLFDGIHLHIYLFHNFHKNVNYWAVWPTCPTYC